jgi:SAM-dependent methyltransferase
MLEFDEEASRAVERVYGTADVAEQRRAVLVALAPRPGERALDLGCGPGLLACELARAVGPEGHVLGLDASPSMRAMAARRDCGAGAAPVEVAEADVAGPLPVDDDAVDLAVSTQVYEYVADIAGALAEARRALRPGGRLLVLDTDWDSIVWRAPDGDDALMARVLAAWDEHLAHRDLPRRLPQLLREAGFALEERSIVPMLNVGYDPGTYSGGLLPIIAAFVPGRGGVGEDEAAAWAEGLRAMGPDYFFALSRFMFLARA